MLPAKPRHVNPWIVTAAVMLATFMEILDTTVVNVSLPHLGGLCGLDGRALATLDTPTQAARSRPLEGHLQAIVDHEAQHGKSCPETVTRDSS
jgi:hypothetical protein